MKRIWIAIVVVCVALVGVIGWQVVKPKQPEPVYKGRRLTAFLRDCIHLSTSSDDATIVNVVAASGAACQVGTNAIPVLLRLLQARDSALKLKLMDLLARQHIVRVQLVRADLWNAVAGYGFGGLGTNAQSAVPELIKIANDGKGRSKLVAVESLGYIGPPAKEAVPYLLELSTNGGGLVQKAAGRALLSIDPGAAAKAGIHYNLPR